jgi:sugar fermentation stimulation protein A
MVYLVPRPDGPSFTVAGDIDPAYAKGLSVARAAGVEAIAYGCRVTTKGVDVTKSLPLLL